MIGFLNTESRKNNFADAKQAIPHLVVNFLEKVEPIPAVPMEKWVCDGAFDDGSVWDNDYRMMTMGGISLISPGKNQSYTMGIKGVIFSEPTHDLGVLIQGLDPTRTVLVDTTLGNWSSKQFSGKRICVDDWKGLQDVAGIIGGANPNLGGDLPFSKQHVAMVRQRLGGKDHLTGLDTIFVHGWHGIATLLDWYAQGHVVAEDEFTFSRQHLSLLTHESIRLLRQLFRAAKRGFNLWLTVPLKPVPSYSTPSPGLIPDIALPDVRQEMLCLADIIVSQVDIWEGDDFHTRLVTDPRNRWGLPAKSSTVFNLLPLENPDLPTLVRKVTFPPGDKSGAG